MKKALILLSGPPGTGKTYFKNMIMARNDNFESTSVDVFKERLYDEIGFDNLDEKKVIDDNALYLFFQKVEEFMALGKSIISDYPFSDKQYSELQRLSQKYGYFDITVSMYAADDVLYERQKSRDKDESRHLGHLMTHYHRGDVVKDRSKIEIMKSKKEYLDFNKKRGYNDFCLGYLIKFDVSDFSRADYDGVLREINSLIG